MDWTGCRHSRIELDFSKSALVVRDVLLQDRGQGLGLLRAEIDPLKIPHLDLILRLLLHGAENQKEIPDVHPYLYAVGIGLAIFISVCDVKIRLRGVDHGESSVNQALAVEHSPQGSGHGP